jgi:hypothetical protein
MITSVLPRAAVNHKLPLAFTSHQDSLAAVWSSFAFDYVARQKIGGTSMTYFYLKQFPSPTPRTIKSSAFGRLATRNTCHLRESELSPQDRNQVRAELDAALFHHYGIDRDNVDYIMDTFPDRNR